MSILKRRTASKKGDESPGSSPTNSTKLPESEQGGVDYCYEVVFLGAGGAGKSSIIRRLMHNSFDGDEFSPTLIDEYNEVFEVDKKKYRLTFVDTAGQEQYYTQREDYIRRGHSFIFVFDITKRLSFEELEGHKFQVERHKDGDIQDIPCIVIATHSEMQDERTVTAAEAAKFAADCGCPLVECSSKTGHNIDKILKTLVDQIHKILADKKKTKKSVFGGIFSKKKEGGT